MKHEKMPVDNMRFGASGGVAPQKMNLEHESPHEIYWEPPRR